MDARQADQSMPSSFGKFELTASKTEEASNRQFKFHASVNQNHEATFPSYPSYPQPAKVYAPGSELPHVQKQHHYVSGRTNETDKAAINDQVAGEAQIPQTMINGKFHQSETITTSFAASIYKEGAHFDLLKIPAEKGKHNYYNGLSNAHFENGYLVGTPVHLNAKGQIEHAMKQEVYIPLHKVNQ